jgi:ankyrin repeat protein
MGDACSVEQDSIQPLRNAGRKRAALQGEDASLGRSASSPAKGSRPGKTNLKELVETQKVDRHKMTNQDLFEAAMAGDVRRITWSLQAQADPNATVDLIGLRPLHLCVAQGHVGAAQVLLEYDADSGCQENSLGLTPLSFACLAGQNEAVSFLVSAGVKLDGPEGDGCAPLLHAARRNFSQACEILVAAGADASVVSRRSRNPTLVHEALHRGELQASFPPWHAPLFNPAAGSPADAVDRTSGELLWLDVEGATPLHFAAAHGNFRICQCLLEGGARARATDCLRRTPLMIASDFGHSEAVRLLLEWQANVSIDVEGHSPATLAARQGHGRIILLLLDHGAVLVDYSPQAGGATMLHIAAQMGHGGCVSLLCENDADVEVTLKPSGIRPLMLAASRGYSDICRELVSYGACVNEVDDEGRTGWLRAASNGHSSVCHILASLGAVERVFVPEARTKHRLSSALRNAHGDKGETGQAEEEGQPDMRRKRVARDSQVRPSVHSSIVYQTSAGTGGVQAPQWQMTS